MNFRLTFTNNRVLSFKKFLCMLKGPNFTCLNFIISCVWWKVCLSNWSMVSKEHFWRTAYPLILLQPSHCLTLSRPYAQTRVTLAVCLLNVLSGRDYRLDITLWLFICFITLFVASLMCVDYSSHCLVQHVFPWDVPTLHSDSPVWANALHTTFVSVSIEYRIYTCHFVILPT